MRTSNFRRPEAQHFWGDDFDESYIIGPVNGHDHFEFKLCPKAETGDGLTKPDRMDELKMVMAQVAARVRSRTVAATLAVKRA